MLNVDLVNLDDVELIKLYRQQTTVEDKAKIFKFLLFRKNKNGKSWHSNISVHINKEINKFRFCRFIDKDDLYQIVLKKFHETIINNFNTSSKFQFATYVWWAIQSSINRIIQDFKTKKRKKDLEFETVNIEDMHESRKVSDIISQNSNYGIFKTVDKVEDFEKTLSRRDLITRIKDELAEKQEIVIDKSLMRELIYLIKNNEDRNHYLLEISIRYDISIEKINEYVTVITSNLQKNLFSDLIVLYENGVKDEDILIEKHKCCKNFIVKARKSISSKLIETMKEQYNLSVKEIFN